MSLCSVCQRFYIRDLLDDGMPQDIPHHKSLENLERSAATCSLCKLFLGDIKTTINGYKETHDLSSTIEEAIWRSTPLYVRGIPSYAQDDYDVKTLGFKLRLGSLDVPEGLKTYWYYSVYLDNPDDESVAEIKDLIPGRKIGPPEEATPLVKRWIEDCERNHSTCRQSSGPLPTRVLDVGQDGDIPRLIQTSRQIAPYLTLSHCWGPDPGAIIRTEWGTIEDRLHGIPMSSLPNTFASAVQITRSLGIQYLWIDSLCIIQDDKEDWERESARMGDIYEQAFATIAATGSPGPNVGCFIPRVHTNHPSVPFSKKSPARVRIRPRPRGFIDLRESPLQRRAWVSQERALSRRTIHYDRDQILFECDELRATEDCISPDEYEVAKAWDKFRPFYDAQDGHPGGNFIWDWYGMVEDYTARALTQGGDKLPAVSGIAKIMEQRTGESYVAGLWRGHLEFGLLWTRKVTNWLTLPSPECGFRAPSWSWASLDGEIAMENLSKGDAMECAVENIQAETTPLGLDSHGKLASGILTLTGRVKAIDPRLDPQSPEWNTAFVFSRNRETEPGDILTCEGKAIGEGLFDREFEQSHQAKPLYCLEVLRRASWRHRWYGLILEAAEKPGEFRRVGYARDLGDSLMPSYGEWFAGTEPCTISIL